MLKVRLYRREIRFVFDKFDLILYRFWPYRFRKVVYPDGPIKMAAGAFRFNRSPSERRHAHTHYLLWEAENELARRRTAEGAGGVAVDGGPIPPATAASGK